MQLSSTLRPKKLHVSYSETLDCDITEWELCLKREKKRQIWALSAKQ